VTDRARQVKSRLAGRGVNVALNGIDGSGKSTLSRQLTDVLRANDLPVECFHIYHWYEHLFKTPWLILFNRHFYRRLFIFDRTHVDNLAVFFSSKSLRWLTLLTIAVNGAYPKFDFQIYITASFEDTVLRRPEINRDRFEKLSECYAVITQYSDHVPLKSDGRLLRAALDVIADNGVAALD